MSNKVVVHIGRYNELTVNMGVDVTTDTITSQIRTEPEQEATLIAAWTVTKTNPTKGELLLTMEATVSSQIDVSSGWMDLKRISGGKPKAVFDRPVEVSFRGSVTA
jgi:hypothetical protein